MANMTTLQRIGTKKIQECFDGKDHELTLTDYLVRLTGNTFKNKSEIYKDGFYWWADKKEWTKNIETEDEINQVYKKYSKLGVNISLKPIFRITDEETNPIDY